MNFYLKFLNKNKSLEENLFSLVMKENSFSSLIILIIGGEKERKMTHRNLLSSAVHTFLFNR